MESTDCPNFLKPKLRLFLSVDLAGSTRFKQVASGDGIFPPWLGVITNFYREFDRLFREEWEHASQKYGEPRFRFGAKPEFWKAVGDELLYSKILTHHTEALSCIHVWIIALQRYRQALEEKNYTPPLSVKSTGWLGGFPVINTEVVVAAPGTTSTVSQKGANPLYDNMRLVEEWYDRKSRGDSPIGLLDFVGPSIDIGFRLASQSTEKKMAISVDLTLMIAMAQFGYRACPYPQLKLYYSGGSVLKGVMESDAYPWFWIDVREASQKNPLEDALLTGTSDAITNFCDEFLEHHADSFERPYVIRPYIEHSEENEFRVRPPKHDAIRDELLKFWRENDVSCETEVVPLDTDIPPVDQPNDRTFMVVVNDLPADLGQS